MVDSLDELKSSRSVIGQNFPKFEMLDATHRQHGGPGRERGYLGCTFLNTTLQAAVHLGQDYEVNLRFVKNHLWTSVEQLFKETGKLSRNQTEIAGVTTIDYNEHTLRSTSLLCDRAYQITNAKTFVFSDSVLCVEKNRR